MATQHPRGKRNGVCSAVEDEFADASVEVSVRWTTNDRSTEEHTQHGDCAVSSAFFDSCSVGLRAVKEAAAAGGEQRGEGRRRDRTGATGERFLHQCAASSLLLLLA